MVTQFILEEETERHTRKIRSIIENLRKDGNGMRENTFWQFKQKLENRAQKTKSVIQGKNSKLIEYKSEILKEYNNLYSELFQKREVKSKEGKREEKG